jgi:hypothetical protein
MAPQLLDLNPQPFGLSMQLGDVTASFSGDADACYFLT